MSRLRIGIITDSPKRVFSGLERIFGAPLTREGDKIGWKGTSFSVQGLTPSQAQVRSMRKFPSFASIHSIKYEMDIGVEGPDDVYDLNMWDVMTRQVLDVRTEFSLTSSSSSTSSSIDSESIKNECSGFTVKEVVLPGFPSAVNPSHRTLENACRNVGPGVYIHESGMCFRLFPTNYATVVFHTSDLDQAISQLDSDVNVDLVGNRALKQQQAKLIHEDLLGLDIRLCDRTEGPLSFFHESNAALMDGLLGGVQSNRVSGGGPDVRETKFQGFGDCYSEFREMAKNPSGFFHARSLPTVRVSDLKLPSE